MRNLSNAELAQILDKDIFHKISDAADSLHLECYVVGGYVRDLFLERPSNDIDVVVVGSGIQVASELKKMLGKKAHLSVFRNFGTAQVKYKDTEVVFRGAILRTLLSSMQSKWGAICFTAALFALIHANPAQMPHAFLMGWLMGWLYMRTGSILPAVVFHWANNTMAYLIAVAYPGKDMKLVDIFSGNETAVLLSVVFSLCIFIPALIQLNIWTKNRGR